MEKDQIDDILIVNTTKDDLEAIFWLFQQAMAMERKNGYQVWKTIDPVSLVKDVENKLHFKILKGEELVGIFSIQFEDPFIWGERDQRDALYLHRIVVSPNFKGKKQFGNVLKWAKQVAGANKLQFVRMDTWADNSKIIAYYTSFGFAFVENFTTGNSPELPAQNRNLKVALLEMKLDDQYK